ncbi:MAG: tRNA pseudouridine(38-40) synthase TruA [Gammaproteobacteria bacterium]|nr:tRNA pseudouridine(38-40) synthase TruA [Gammaproteobacteria bacterium]
MGWAIVLAMGWAIVLAYDGSHYHGSAPQPGIATVVGGLTQSLERLRVDYHDLALAGRTDAGVHARFQLVSLEAPSLAEEHYPRLQAILPQGVMLRVVMRTPAAFHARHSAQWRQYRYRIRRASHDPLFPLSWQISHPLDVGAMSEVASYLRTVESFEALCKAGSAGGFRRRIHSIELAEREGFFEISVLGASFCHQMVRRIVGALVQVGRRRWSPEYVIEAVDGRDRALLSELAPAHGLYLWRVGYNQAWEWAAERFLERGFEEDWSVIDRLELPFPLEWSAECPHYRHPS